MSADETNRPWCGLKFQFPALIFLKQPADVPNHLQNLLPFSCYSQSVGSQSINPLCQQKLMLIFAPNHLQLRPISEKDRTCDFFLFLGLLCLFMANPAEQYQVEISEIFDQFLDLMRTSCACVDIECRGSRDIVRLNYPCGNVDCAQILYLPLFSLCVILLTWELLWSTWTVFRKHGGYILMQKTLINLYFGFSQVCTQSQLNLLLKPHVQCPVQTLTILIPIN